MKNNKMFIYLFVFMFGLLCMSFDDVYALGASNYNTKCEYSFTDHKSKNGTLYVYPSGDKTTFGIGNIEVEFDGQGMHTCDERCEKESRKVFAVENNKLYCPDSAYYCYDGGKNMIVDSKRKCKENPEILQEVESKVRENFAKAFEQSLGEELPSEEEDDDSEE